MIQFNRRLIGYNAASVAQVMAEMEAEHARATARLLEEIAAAKEATEGLQNDLSRLEAELKEVEARMEQQMSAALQVIARPQAAYEEATRRREEQLQQFQARIRERTELLAQIEGMQNSFTQELRHLVQGFRSKLTTAGSDKPAGPETRGDA